jgi:transposase
VIEDKEIREAYEKGPEAVIALIKNLFKGFELTVAVLEARIRQLEGQINTNSKNSGKPPSSDGLARTKSLRKKSGKKSGAQKGHRGHTLEMVDHPDRIEALKVERCRCCGSSLADRRAEAIERRQVFDTPPQKLIVTEYRAERKTCLTCGALNKASFPEGISQPAQYGPEIKSLAVYLNQYHLIPYERVTELLADVFGQPIAEGTLFAANEAVYEALECPEQEVKQQLLASPVIDVDETGARVEGKTQWLHTVSTPSLTCYSIHERRGTDAMDEMGILPFYTGIAKHDFWKPYFKYSCVHSLCNDHHLRELTWVMENLSQDWAGQMKDLLLAIKAAVDEARDNSETHLKLEQLVDFESRYSRIIAFGYEENPFFEVWEPKPKSKRRGRIKKTKARNLLERLDKHRTEALNFMYDFRIPFGNNLAERDIRMTKVQQKISGGFRSLQGARIFCRIRGYISTIKKNSVPVLGAIRDALLGNPFVPGFSTG